MKSIESLFRVIQFSSINLKISVLMLCEVNRVIIQSDSVQFNKPENISVNVV